LEVQALGDMGGMTLQESHLQGLRLGDSYSLKRDPCKVGARVVFEGHAFEGR